LQTAARRSVNISGSWGRKFEFGTFLLGSGKARSETRIARLEHIDNTYVSA